MSSNFYVKARYRKSLLLSFLYWSLGCKSIKSPYLPDSACLRHWTDLLLHDLVLTICLTKEVH